MGHVALQPVFCRFYLEKLKLPTCFCLFVFPFYDRRVDEELLQTAVMMTTTAAGSGPPLAAMLTDLPPHFCTRQLGVTMMQGSSATLGRGKTRWVSRVIRD